MPPALMYGATGDAAIGPTMVALVAFAILSSGVVVVFSRRTRRKMRDTYMSNDPKPPVATRTRRQQRIVETLEPAGSTPTIEELVAAEVAETGVNNIAGAEGLADSLKLRVWWRDEVVRNGCTDGHLEFRLDEGVAQQDAVTEDLRIVCVRRDGTDHHPAGWSRPEANPVAGPTAGADDDETGNSSPGSEDS